MSVKIKIIRERLQGKPIIGNSWQLVSIVRQRLSLIRESSRREIERRERENRAMRRVEAQFIRGV